MNNYNCIVVLGPTASGKTRLACALAYELNGEIISADSRQVYKHLDIGTGKDLSEYLINGHKIPYHLIDIYEPDQQFFLHDFMAHCKRAFEEILRKGKVPIICGGTGLYLDSLRKDFSFTQIKENTSLRQELEKFPKEILLKKLSAYPAESIQHTDTNSKKRIIRAIEVAEFLKTSSVKIKKEEKPYRPFYIGIRIDVEERKKRIAERLKFRLENGMIEEVENLIRDGLSHERLQELGLEYKYISLFLQNKLSRTEMTERLQTAIFQFAKRQMTWFRKMEKEGIKIHWTGQTAGTQHLIQSFKSGR